MAGQPNLFLSDLETLAVIAEDESDIDEYIDLFLERRAGIAAARYKKSDRADVSAWIPDDALADFRFDMEDLGRLAVLLKIPDPFIGKTGSKATAVEALAIVCRRICYPSRWCDMRRVFRRDESGLQDIFMTCVKFLDTAWRHLLDSVDFRRVGRGLRRFADAIHAKGAPLTDCFAFIDCVSFPVSRPKVGQRELYNGKDKDHVIKFQGICTPDGILVGFHGPHEGCRHDQTILTRSAFAGQLQAYLAAHPGTHFYVYGDKGYSTPKPRK